MLLNGCLALMFLLFGGAFQSFAQEKLSLAKPLRKCRVYAGNNGLTRIIASDNEQNLILSTDNLSIISLNPESGTESWKSLTGGRLESEIYDSENLYFVNSFENEDRRKTFTLNSISLKTGLTNWQLKLNEHSNIKLSDIKSRDNVFLIVDDSSIVLVSKQNGKISWTKQFPASIVASVIPSDQKADGLLHVISEDGLKRVSVKNGEVLGGFKLKKNETNDIIVGDGYVLSGYPTGEIIKTSAGDNENDILWKVKAGAGISGIIAYHDEILVTSLDNFIYLYSVDSGKLKWKKRVAGRINFKPQIYGDLAVVVNSGDNSASVIDLKDGKIINQILLEPETYFTGQPSLLSEYLVLQTSRGIQIFADSGLNCK